MSNLSNSPTSTKSKSSLQQPVDPFAEFIGAPIHSANPIMKKY